MLAVHLVTRRLLAAAWTAPEVSEEEDSYASYFYRWFSESFEELSFTSRGSARFNWHSFTVSSLKVPAMIVYDVAMKVLDTK